MRPHWIVSLTVLLLGAQSCFAGSSTAMYDVGVDLYNKRNFRAAAIQFELHAKAHPNDAKALYYAGLCYHQLNDTKKAKLFYDQAVQIAPSSEAARAARAMIARLGGASMPAPSSSSSAQVRSSGAASQLSSDFASLPADVRIYYTGDAGQMLVDATINGRRKEMLFDTGAPQVVIGKKQLQELGLPVPSGPPTGKVPGAANASLVNFWDASADIKVGQIDRKGVKIQVLEDNPPFALLGQNFFQDFTYTVDSGSKSIRLTKRTQAQPQIVNAYTPRDPSVVPFTWDPNGRRIVVSVEVNGRPSEMIFDTGNVSSAITFPNLDSLKKFGLKLPEDAKETTAVGASGEGAAYEFTVSRIKLGPIDRNSIEVKVNKEGGMERPLVGQAFWSGWEYTIDMDRKVIRFKRR